MFEKKQNTGIGATEKLAIAKRMREVAQEKIDRNAGVKQRPAIPAAIIFALAVVLAVIITDGGIHFSGGLQVTGFPRFDQILAGINIPNTFGDGDVNRVVFMFVRGFSFFLLAGIPALLARILMRVFDQRGLSPYMAIWAANLLLAIYYFIFIYI